MTAKFFDEKAFNPQVFGKYLQKAPNFKNLKMIKSGAIARSPYLASLFNAQTGNAYMTIPYSDGELKGDPVNYDGKTDIPTYGTRTYTRSIQSFGRAIGWTESDFAIDITSGYDAMSQVVATGVNDYWAAYDQSILLSVLKGIFNVSDGAANLEFVDKHTTDITSATGEDSQGNPLNCVRPATLNTATQRACGDNKDIFSLVFVHSSVATNLENMRLIKYLQYTDKNGIQQDLSIATWNGRTVIVTDEVPTKTVVTGGTAGVYTLTITTAFEAGETITVNGITYRCVTSPSAGSPNEFAEGSSAADQATSLAALIGANETEFTVAATAGGAMTFTQKIPGRGVIPSVFVSDSSTGSSTIEQTTAGVAGTEDTTYTTYILGSKSIILEPLRVYRPQEMVRSALTNGGMTTLVTRRRRIIWPFGFSYLNDESLSAETPDFENGANWTIMNTGGCPATRSYIPHKTIPIAKIVSKG